MTVVASDNSSPARLLQSFPNWKDNDVITASSTCDAASHTAITMGTKTWSWSSEEEEGALTESAYSVWRAVSCNYNSNSPPSIISIRLMMVSNVARRTLLSSSPASSTSSGRSSVLVSSILKDKHDCAVTGWLFLHVGWLVFVTGHHFVGAGPQWFYWGLCCCVCLISVTLWLFFTSVQWVWTLWALPETSGDVLKLTTHTGSDLRFHILTERAGQRQQLLLHSDVQKHSNC